jgi:hypothetical protein
LEGIRKFLGEDAKDYIIAVFSHADKKQIMDRDVMRKSWNAPVASFIKELENRWGISPNPDYFPPNDPIHKARLGEIKALISGMRGVFTSELLKKARQEQERIQRQKEEDEAKARREREENEGRKARQELEREYREKLEEIVKRSEEEKKELMALIRKSIENPTVTTVKSGCFSLDTEVQLASGKFIEMAELQVGDRVCSNVRNGELEFSEVYLISHLGHCNFFLEMIKIEFTNSDGQKGILFSHSLIT